jgi:hypothetical protein
LESNGHRRTENEARHRPFPGPQRHTDRNDQKAEL